MSKKMLIVLNDDARELVEALAEEANHEFEAGSISYSDVINEMVVSAKVDVKALQRKHTNVRLALRSLAAKESLELDSVIKTLLALKAGAPVKKGKVATMPEATVEA